MTQMTRLHAAAAVLVLVTSVAPAAQRGRRGGGNANAGLPLATNAILRNPDVYYGRQITVSAGVDRMLSKTAFVVDQWKMTGPEEVAPLGQPILVVAPYLTSALDRRSYLLMRGELVRLDTAALARVASEYKLDLGPDLWEKFQGRPMLLAASVMNSSYIELAKKPLLPPTAGELAMSEAMKTISPAFTALRAGADESRAEAVAQNVMKLQPAFAQAEAVWDGIGQSAAAQLARDAQEQLSAIQHDAAAGNWDKVKFTAGRLNQVCGTCHGTFRDRADDGSFRFKAGSF